MPRYDIDDKDRIILEMLERNPEVSQNEIAKVVGLSQPSVGSRIKKLRELGIVDHCYGINVRNTSLYLMKVDVKCRNPKDILERFAECPYFLNGFVVAGERNLTLFFIGEELTTLEAIVDKHIRSDPNVYNAETGIVIRAQRDAVMPMKMKVERREKAPCMDGSCSDCDFWKLNLCLGCPITGHYRGKIW